MSTYSVLRGIFFTSLTASAALAQVTITPSATQTINEAAKFQYTASEPATWAASCGGSISSTGLFTAGTYPKTCTITATSTTDGSSAQVTLNIVSPITMSPVTPTTPQGQTVQFTSSAPVVWTVGCGTITSGGLYTASAAVGSYCTVEGTAASGTQYHVYGYDHILKPVTNPFTVSPTSATVSEGATQQFTASAGATWTSSCGSISTTGLFTAPLSAGSCTVTATPTAGGSAVTAAVTVTSPIVITPSSTTTGQNLTQQFSANMAVIWAASCGSISGSGLFTASGTPGAVCQITATAASAPAYTGTATDTIAANPFTVSPTSATVSEAATQQFTASAGATWASSCGTISTTGLFTAPLSAGSCTVTATPTAGGSAVKAAVTVTSPITITPSSTTTLQNSTQQFSANMAVTWASSCGSISGSGLFTASGTPGAACTITATAASGPAYTGTATDTIGSGTFSVSPASVTMNEVATQQFTATAPATWTVSCGGSINSSGLFTAGSYPKTCTVTATPTGGGTAANATVNIVSPITMSPVTPTTPQGQTVQFTSSAPVVWTVSCGSITSGGLYTASAAVGSYCTIEGTATSGTQYHVYGYDHTVAPFTMSPTSAALSEGATQQFTASAAAAWSASCGTISASGLFTAPLSAGSCTVSATPTAGGYAVTAPVSVASPVTVTPSAATTSQNSTQQFTANVAATWSSSCGSINSAGIFTASGSQGAVCSIVATAASGPAYTGTATDTIGAPYAFTISPTTVTVTEGATQQFTASGGATWTSSCGAISGAGLFTAPLTPGACTVTGTPTGAGTAATAAVTVSSPITITPASLNLHAMNTLTLTASQPVTWNAGCGSITTGGVFTAPIAAASCTLTAKASSGTAYTAQVPVNVDVVNYTAWKGGGGITGAQTDELALTPANVNAASFGIQWTASVDALVSAQPLYMNALMINGVPHNVVFVATENDSVYAFDGDTGAVLWQVSLIPPGATSVTAASVGYTSSQQVFGIMGTPVIDPTTNTMYMVSETSEQNATVFPDRLHALDITTGAEKFGGPVPISNPQLQPAHKLQRPGLLLTSNTVYVGFGSMQDKNPYNGMLFAFNAGNLQQEQVWVATPTGIQGGIWMGGAAPSVDEDGNVFVSVGQGTFDGTNNFGEAAVKLSPTTLQVLDYFAPYNYPSLDSADLDLGSSGVIVVPDQTGGLYPHELIVCGKWSSIYVLNRDSMGQVGTTSDNVIQVLSGQVGAVSGSGNQTACLAPPAIWGQNVYFGGKNDVLKMFTLNPSTGMLSSTPVSQGSLVYGGPGADAVISSDGATDGIVWTLDMGTSTLRANDATNVANVFYSGELQGGVFSWEVPTVANGHVYVGGQTTVFAFGLTQPPQ